MVVQRHSDSRQFVFVNPEPEHGPVLATEHLRFHWWISDELLAETQWVWSQAYDREIAADEAIQILLNVRRLAEVLLRAGSKEIAA
jgi:hypothetical protein